MSSNVRAVSSQASPSTRPLRIVIDMQGAQSESRFRGIGRYTMSFAQAIVRNRGDNEIFLVLSGLFPDTIEPIRLAFKDLLPQENIRVWYAPGPLWREHKENEFLRNTAEIIREAFIENLLPDIIHICSVFEGFGEDAAISVDRLSTPAVVSVTLHDLIPLINQEEYLSKNRCYADFYYKKLAWMNRAKVILAVSESAKKEGEKYLQAPNKLFYNTSEAADPLFKTRLIDEPSKKRVYNRHLISKPFLLCSGGGDERKNLPRLVKAYALLPEKIRQAHQLVFAGKLAPSYVETLKEVANAAGLDKTELVFTGYVSDDSLVDLYNLCELYVFPSWHEGFGLPALEAMACGAPVIGADTSSLPEVIGFDEALFNPLKVASITAKMKQALSSDDFRVRLRKHGLQQSKRFSWEETAKRSINAWEALRKLDNRSYLESSTASFRLISEVSKYASTDEKYLVELASCIAANQAGGIKRQLLLDISELSQRDAATGVQRVVRSYLKWLLQSPPSCFRVEPVYAMNDEGYRYARRYTQRFLELDDVDATDDPVSWQRGDVFFGLDMQHHVQLANKEFYRHLQQEGVIVKFMVYDLLPIQLPELFKDSDARQLHELWLSMVATTDGAVCISKATRDALIDWAEKQAILCSPYFKANWVHLGADIDGSQPSQGLPENAHIVIAALHQRTTFLCVSTLEPRKRQEQILDAVEKLWMSGFDVNLVFVGQQGWKIESFMGRLRVHTELDKRLFWLQAISDEYLEKIYTASSCMIAASLNEGFGLPLIEAARHGISLIARDIPVFREVAGDYAYYFDGETPQALAEVLKAWLQRYRSNRCQPSAKMPWLTWEQSTERLKAELIDQDSPRRQLLVDISELVQRDARTGIQRVVRSVLMEWLLNPPMGYRVEPIYATVDKGYRYARSFTSHFIGAKGSALLDEPIDYAPGDVFFALDLQPQVHISQKIFYQALRRAGVCVKFLVYDLLCILMPHHFPPGSDEGFIQWLQIVAESDGAVCISKTVSHELSEWIGRGAELHGRSFRVDWFHLGADITKSRPTQGLPSGADATLEQLNSRPTFLMVGTIEPRKGHDQVLDAFDLLWTEGSEINLVIVGKIGWMVEILAQRINHHPQLNVRLFWQKDISDEFLEKIYAASTCLIAASYGEGFGLPLIEAAQHKLPIIARDIPIFREVAGEHACYFEATTPKHLAQSIQSWIDSYKIRQHKESDKLPWMRWSESVAKLNACLLSYRGSNDQKTV